MVALLMASTAGAADDDLFFLVHADRLEYLPADDTAVWDVQAWLGDDYRKLWIKAEGDRESGNSGENELQLLYSRAFTPFFDWQVGLRRDIDPAPSRTHVVLGIQGLAPQWFEIDAAAFVSDDGDVSARVEVEYDWLLTQRLVLQPRLEAELALHDVPELAVGSGLVETDLGLRLRYEITRKFAPYVGVRWARRYGSTADRARARGDDVEDVAFLAGFRAWF